MSLFAAPGWDNPGAAPVVSPFTKRANKRKRGAPGIADIDDQAESPTTTTGQNIQKLMRKMHIEKEKASGLSDVKERIKPLPGSESKAKKKRTMQPPASSSPKVSTKDAMPSSSPHSSSAVRASKKPRIRREDSDVLPPSSAGDETEPIENPITAKRKKNKKQKKRSPDSESAPARDSRLLLSEPDSETNGEFPPRSYMAINGTKKIEFEAEGDEYAGLTKLQRAMKQKLTGGRFRMINELLYKSDSASAHEMMRKDSAVFDEYHVGFRNQVVSWPQNPVEHFTKSISAEYSAVHTTVVDLGCGDATLAKNLAPLGFKVLSYDLVSDGEWVTEADICAKIPLPGKEDRDVAQVADICVCALSLMSTNWAQCIREARRILKARGVLEIAEVTSRFTDVDAFTSLICRIGFELESKTEPSTHFVLFKFKKCSRVLAHKDWINIETKSKDLLAPCEYKRR